MPDCNNLQSDLNRLQRWSDTWLMKINLTKCYQMWLGQIVNEGLIRISIYKEINFSILCVRKIWELTLSTTYSHSPILE